MSINCKTLAFNIAPQPIRQINLSNTINMRDNANDVKHKELLNWVKELADHCTPDKVYWCDGSKEEYDNMNQALVDKGTFKRLDPNKWPNSYACFSDPSDVARVEDRTYICSRRKEDAGPTNNWEDPKVMRETMHKLFKGCMKGRTMYVQILPTSE